MSNLDSDKLTDATGSPTNPISPTLNLPKKYNKRLILPVGFLVLLLVMVSFAVRLTQRKQNISHKDNIKLSKQIEPKIKNENNFSIFLLKTDISVNAYKSIPGYAGPYQPDFFDPKISKFHKIQQKGSPSETYVLDNDPSPGYGMMINGWRDGENSQKINLLQPFDFNFYEFGCASSFSFVTELTKNSQRQALYSLFSYPELYSQRLLKR